MSQAKTPFERQANSEEAVREQLRDLMSPSDCRPEKSAQATGDFDSNRGNDGEQIYKAFSIPPLHKYLAKCARQESPRDAVARYPSSLVCSLVNLSEREIELVEWLAAEDAVDYDFRDPHVSHEALEDQPPLRAKVLEWLADDPERIKPFIEGGTDAHLYGPPGRGKSTLANFLALTSQQVNNATVLWADTLDASGTSERVEWLPLAPWTTLALPAGFPVEVRVVPEDPTVQTFTVDVEEIVRDVVRYESPRDLLGQLKQGQFYVVFPDPLLRGCEEVSRFAFNSVRDVTPQGEPGPTSPTPANQWWFAFIAARVSLDEYLHPTAINIDEAGNLIDPDASKDEHDTYQKIKWLKNKYADARKKNLSFWYQTHYIHEVHQMLRAKVRWWVTMNGASPPIGKTLPGDKECPMHHDRTSSMDKGQAQIWRPGSQTFADFSWPNLKRDARLDAEISFEFPTWSEARGGA